jgi:hypothetical protein
LAITLSCFQGAVFLCTALSSQCLDLRSIEVNDIDLVMLAQIGISPTVTVTIVMRTIYFDCERMITWDWSNYPSEQTHSTFGFLKRMPLTGGQSPEQEIFTISTKPDLNFGMEASFYQKFTGLPELRAIQLCPSPNISSPAVLPPFSLNRLFHTA